MISSKHPPQMASLEVTHPSAFFLHGLVFVEGLLLGMAAHVLTLVPSPQQGAGISTHRFSFPHLLIVSLSLDFPVKKAESIISAELPSKKCKTTDLKKCFDE